jgi:hypothetical protein
MKKSSENKGITATGALKNEFAGKASMPEVRRRMVTEQIYPVHLWRIYRQMEGIYAVLWRL